MKKILALTSLLLFFSFSTLFAVTISDESVSGVDRYAIYIGSNYGGKSRERLLYAGTDAQSFKNAMAEIGGVSETNSRILIDPSKETVDKALEDISNAITGSTNNSKRSEFIFYYSGHSDENAILLGDTKYDYSKLKAAITAVPSDIHVVILDSCYSGNFIRTKGGQKRKPFLIDDSSVVTGHAYLSSSSDNESSQESDEIAASYFTNAMITGLRGAADTSGDNKVTLNELYSYAFNDTLSKTETSKAGPQHPNYNITLVGSGDLILSDLTTAESMLSLSKEAKGKFIIRDANDKLISEINKIEGQPIFMALPSGQYSALIVDEYATKQGTFILEKDQVYVLDQNSLSSIKRKTNRLRGNNELIENDDDEFLTLDDLEETKEEKYRKETATDTEEILDDSSDESDSDEILDLDFDFAVEINKKFNYLNAEPFSLLFVPGVYFVGEDSEDTLFSVGIIGSKVKNLGAIQYSTIFNIATGNVFGGQISEFFNISTNRLDGIQIAPVFNVSSGILNGIQMAGGVNIGKEINGMQIGGIFNYGKEVNGMQLSGLINVANTVNGAQIGLINIAEKNNGITFGLINYVEDGLHDLTIAFDSDDCVDLFYQGGAKHLFTTLGFAKPRENYFEDSSFGSIYLGLGTELPLAKTSFDFEFLWKFVYNEEIGKELSELDREFSDAEIEEQLASLSIPSFKITWNFYESPFSRVFIACAFDINIPDWNDYAFKIYKKSWIIDSGDYRISPVISAGWKMKL